MQHILAHAAADPYTKSRETANMQHILAHTAAVWGVHDVCHAPQGNRFAELGQDAQQLFSPHVCRTTCEDIEKSKKKKFTPPPTPLIGSLYFDEYNLYYIFPAGAYLPITGHE